jgi:hypothetical protein
MMMFSHQIGKSQMSISSEIVGGMSMSGGCIELEMK